MDRDFKLNKLLHLNDNEIKNCKIELNMTAGKGKEKFIKKYLEHTLENKQNGTCKDCSYWAWKSEGIRNYQENELVLSFVQLKNIDEWLLISVGKIKNVIEGKATAGVEIDDRFKHLFGRLVINYKRENGYLYIFKLAPLKDKITVKEILPSVYDGIPFPGYDKVNISFTELETYINKKDWETALANQKAVYLQIDTKKCKFYVGSATSEKGMLLSRWKNYLRTGHGGNEGLKEISFGYIKENFRYSILETFNAKVDDEIILKRESWWKDLLLTRNKKHGYNKN